MYAGLLQSLVKECPYAAVYLLLYTQCKSAMATWAARWKMGAMEADNAEATRHRTTTAFHVEGRHHHSIHIRLHTRHSHHTNVYCISSSHSLFPSLCLSPVMTSPPPQCLYCRSEQGSGSTPVGLCHQRRVGCVLAYETRSGVLGAPGRQDDDIGPRACCRRRGEPTLL